MRDEKREELREGGVGIGEWNKTIIKQANGKIMGWHKPQMNYLPCNEMWKLSDIMAVDIISFSMVSLFFDRKHPSMN